MRMRWLILNKAPEPGMNSNDDSSLTCEPVLHSSKKMAPTGPDASDRHSAPLVGLV